MKYLYLFLSLLFITPFSQASTKHLGTWGAWEVYQSSQKGKNTYYMMSKPYKRIGPSKGGRSPYLMVSLLNNQPYVTLHTGIPLKDFSKLRICPGKECHTLFSKKDRAWAPDQATERKIIEGMKKYNFLRAHFSNGSKKCRDHYSLKGFQKAFQSLLKASKNP